MYVYINSFIVIWNENDYVIMLPPYDKSHCRRCSFLWLLIPLVGLMFYLYIYEFLFTYL